MRCSCGRKITQTEGSGKDKVWICECGNRYHSPEEIDTGDRAPRYVGEVPPATPTTCRVCGIPVPEEIRETTKEYTPRVLCVEHFSEWWNSRTEVSK